MSCAFIGDSIALGLALANPSHCSVYAHKGYSVQQVSVPKRSFDRAYLSVGSNPPTTTKALVRFRQKVKAKRVTWILPVKQHYRVARVAAQFGDRTVSFTPSRDGVHPQSYSSLVRKLR